MKSPRRGGPPKSTSKSTSVSAPISRTRRQTQVGPSFARREKLTVSNSVLLTSVIAEGTSPFSAGKYMVQPGDPEVFPWLNKIARNFEYYRVIRLSARYENACSTTTPGQILLFWDYDVTDPVPTTFAQASVMSGNKLSAPWDRFLMTASTSAIHRQEPTYYVATSATANRLNDACSLMICTIPSLGTEQTVWGNVWLDFTFEFSVPAYETSVSDTNGTLTVYEQPIQVPAYPDTSSLINNPLSPVSPVLDGLHLGPISPQTSLSVGGMVSVPPGRYRMGTTPNIRGTAGSGGAPQRIQTDTMFAISDADDLTVAVVTPPSISSNVTANELPGAFEWIVDTFERILDLPVTKWVAPMLDYTVTDIAEMAVEQATSFFLEYLGPSLLLAESKSLSEAESKFYSRYLHSTLARHEKRGIPLSSSTARKFLAVADSKTMPRILAIENASLSRQHEAGRRPPHLPSTSLSPSSSPSTRDSHESCCPNR